MYLNHFRLTKHPFHVTPDPEFLYMSPSHREALASIIYGVEGKKGFVAIIGDVGVGKTTILRSYLDQVDRTQLKTIYVFDPNLSFKDLVQTIIRGLGVDSKSDNFFEMVPNLQEALIEEYRHGRNVVLIIDEAQNMPVESLENLRMLSNLETSTEKLLQIVLCGQSEFDDLLNRRELRALHQRISIKAYIVPLSRTECVEYIRHRLSLAGRKDTELFTSSARDRIIATSRGIPRTINILCDNGLITAFGARQNRVTGNIAREIIDGRSPKKRAGARGWSIALSGLLLAIPAGVILYHGADWIPSLHPSNADVRQQGSRRAIPVAENEAPADLRPGNDPEAETGPNGKTRSSVVRTARKGDSVSALGREVYGFFDMGMIGRIQEANPWIRNPDRIMVGDNIYFPDLDRKTGWKSGTRRENP